MSDANLVARAQEGDVQAFEELVQKYQRQVYALACRLVMDGEEAKDLTQQALLQAFLHIRDFRQQSQFRTWLFRIAINQCYDYLKSRKRFGDRVNWDDVVLVSHDSPEEDLAAQDERRRLHAALALLPAKQRAVVSLKIDQGLSYQEISQTLGGTVGAARVNFCQALKSLKKYLRKEAEDEVAVQPYPGVAPRISRR